MREMSALYLRQQEQLLFGPLLGAVKHLASEPEPEPEQAEREGLEEGVPAASEAVGTSICPRAFSPQQCAAPLASMAHVCVAPAESVGVSARASDAATTSRHASRAASPARIAALQRASRCQRGRKRSDRRAAVSCTKT